MLHICRVVAIINVKRVSLREQKAFVKVVEILKGQPPEEFELVFALFGSDYSNWFEDGETALVFMLDRGIFSRLGRLPLTERNGVRFAISDAYFEGKSESYFDGLPVIQEGKRYLVPLDELKSYIQSHVNVTPPKLPDASDEEMCCE